MSPPKPTSSKPSAQKRTGLAEEQELGISLNEVHRRLVHEFRDRAPARITLHRHSATGALDNFVVRTNGARRYFNAARVLSYYRAPLIWADHQKNKAAGPAGRGDQPRQSPHTSGQGRPTNQAAQLLAIDPQSSETITQAIIDTVLPAIQAAQVAAMKEAAQESVELIRQAMSPMSELLTKVHDQLADLSKTRQTLMLKYDATANLSAQQLAAAQEEVKRLRRSDDATLNFTRLQIEIRRVQDILQGMSGIGGPAGG